MTWGFKLWFIHRNTHCNRLLSNSALQDLQEPHTFEFFIYVIRVSSFTNPLITPAPIISRRHPTSIAESCFARGPQFLLPADLSETVSASHRPELWSAYILLSVIRGFTMPESLAERICSLRAFAVTAMTGMWIRNRPSVSISRIFRTHVRPSYYH